MADIAREEKWSEWMRAANAGDERVYHALLAEIAPFLRMLARRRFGQLGATPNEVEDVVQEALIAIHLKRGSWDPSRPIGPWLSAIVRNKLTDALRRRGRHVSVPIEEVIETLSAVDSTEREENLRDAEKLLGNLKDRQREIVRSISLEGKDMREIAKQLNMSEGAVRVTLHRALKSLAQVFGKGGAV